MDLTIYESISNRIKFLQGIYKDKIDQKADVEELVDKLREENDILNKVEKVIKFLMDKLVQKDLSKLDALITYGLKTVYSDRDLIFNSEVMERGKKMWIDLQTIYNGQKIDQRSKSSVHVIESFLLRLLCIIKLKRSRLLLLDETFSSVDPGYIENLSQLILQLCKKLDIDVFLVTHNAGFIDYATHSYRITKKDKNIEVIKVK